MTQEQREALAVIRQQIPQGFAQRCRLAGLGHPVERRRLVLWATLETEDIMHLTDTTVREPAAMMGEELLLSAAADALVQGIEAVNRRKMKNDAKAFDLVLTTLRRGIRDLGDELDMEFYRSIVRGLAPTFSLMVSKGLAYLALTYLTSRDQKIFREAIAHTGFDTQRKKGDPPLIVLPGKWPVIVGTLRNQGVVVTETTARQVWSRAWRQVLMPRFDYFRALADRMHDAQKPQDVDEFLKRWGLP